MITLAAVPRRRVPSCRVATVSTHGAHGTRDGGRTRTAGSGEAVRTVEKVAKWNADLSPPLVGLRLVVFQKSHCPPVSRVSRSLHADDTVVVEGMKTPP